MYKTKLCLGTSTQYNMSIENQIRLFKSSGFDAFFTMWDENLAEYKKIADSEDIIFQSVHCGFMNAASMWSDCKDANPGMDDIIKCIRDTAEIGVDIVVVHPYKGFDEKDENIMAGIENFSRVMDEAKKSNVKIAFENVEGEQYLEILMNAFGSYDNVGFCWDSGHELCYNRGKDMLNLYGNKLIATHLNDNLGVSDYDGKIFFTDDLHLLPFDGITDWKNVASRLNKCGYNGILTFELNTLSKRGRHENDKYAKLPLEEYIAECYIRACKFAYIKQNIR